MRGRDCFFLTGLLHVIKLYSLVEAVCCSHLQLFFIRSSRQPSSPMSPGVPLIVSSTSSAADVCLQPSDGSTKPQQQQQQQQQRRRQPHRDLHQQRRWRRRQWRRAAEQDQPLHPRPPPGDHRPGSGQTLSAVSRSLARRRNSTIGERACLVKTQTYLTYLAAVVEKNDNRSVC